MFDDEPIMQSHLIFDIFIILWKSVVVNGYEIHS